MRRDDFTASAPGTLKKGPEGFWTFSPAPLPPATIQYSPTLVKKIADAERALGELAGVGRMLPNSHLLIHPFLRREAVLSSRIEGTVTRLDELLRFEAQAESDPENLSDIREVLNYVRALDYGLERLDEGMPLCLRLLREIHERLMREVRGGEKRPGEFRAATVLIARPGQSPEEARFVPPPHTDLNHLLTDFEKFLSSPGDLSLIVQLALAHYQFEAIHPFTDGNGRMGRLLITLLLCERKCLPQPLLYLSAYFDRHDAEYRDHLLHISQRAAWEDWIAFFASGVVEQAQDAAARARKLLDLQQKYRERMQKTSQSTAILRLVDRLFTSPFITIPGAAMLLGITHRAATQNIEKLVARKILKLSNTGRRRGKVFVAHQVLKLLTVGMPKS